ncbi:MAG: response regulator [Halieaceae bacterium]
MTQHFDFVALGWVEKYLREEMDTAKSHLRSYERETDEVQHLREAQRNVHSASGVLRLCALDPAALLTEEIERVIGQLIEGKIAGEARKLAMTELAAAMEALPAYLANVRAKREVSAGAIANVINDLRHFGNRPSLPDSLFFSPPIKLNAGVTQGQAPAQEAKLKQFGARAMRVCAQYSKAALKSDREALKQLYAVGKHATPLLAGSKMEPYFRCHMGMIEALAQPYLNSDEVVVDVFKYTFAFLKSMALTGIDAIDNANPTPYIKKMLYYIAKTPAPTALQQDLRDTFDIQNVDDVGIDSAGRLIQEDDLLDALGHTLAQLLEVMEFITSQHREISASNSVLSATIVPSLRQVGLQLKAIGLNTHAATIAEQHEALEALAQAEEPAEQAELLDFGGALIAVKENLEHKLKHGLSAEGDSMGHDLDSAIMGQTIRCLNDMKNSINREFSRQELLQLKADPDASEPVTAAQLRPVTSAAALVDESELESSIAAWQEGELPSHAELLAAADSLLAAIPENAYAEQAAADMEQVVSVLALMDEKQRESGILGQCIQYIRDSIGLGGLVNDAGMACFAEAIAALEQFMERRTEDPLGNSDDHLDRAEARGAMLASFVEQRANALPTADNVLQFSSQGEDGEIADELVLDGMGAEEDSASALELDIEEREPVPLTDSPDLAQPEAEDATTAAGAEPEAAAAETVADEEVLSPTPAASSGLPWREALAQWLAEEVARGPDAPPEDPSADVDEELVDIFVEEARKYVRKIQDAAPLFAQELDNEKTILDIRAVFHTMKGSARTIELNEVGEFMFDMEKIFNALRDGYIKGTPEIAELLDAVTTKLPAFIELITQGVPLYTVDFHVPHCVAGAISEKRFDPDSMLVSGPESGAAAEPTEAEPEPVPAEPEQVSAATEEVSLAPEQASTDPWQAGTADAVIEALSSSLNAADAHESGLHSASALILLHAVVPALVELNEAGMLELGDAALSHFLQMAVVKQAAQNEDSGLVDVGTGTPVLIDLSASTIEGLQRYMETLEQGEMDARDMHANLEGFMRAALKLPEPESMVPMPDVAEPDLGSLADEDGLDDIELLTEPYDEQTAGGGAPSADYSIEDIPLAEPPDSGADTFAEQTIGGDPLSPKLDGASEPEAILGSESAATEDIAGLDEDFSGSLDDFESELPDLESGVDGIAGHSLELDDVLADEVEPSAGEEPSADKEPSSTEEAATEADPLAAQEPREAIVGAEAHDDIDAELLEVLLETLDETMESIDSMVAGLESDTAAATNKLKNILHTLKGGANSVGLRKYGALVHDIESHVVDLERTGTLSSAESQASVYARVDTLSDASRFVAQFHADWDPDKAASGAGQLAAGGDEEEEGDEADDTPQAKRVDSLRVATSKIDRLLDMGLEVSMSNVRSRRALDKAYQDRTSVQALARRVEELVDKLSLQLDTEIQAKTEAMPEGEQFDPLEMDRLTEKQGLAAILREAAFDLHAEARELGDHVDTAMREAVRSGRLVEGSQSELRLLRLVNFSRLGPGFRRLVHQVSRQLGKNVDFDMTCDDGGLDVSVFEQVKTALEHMLRNAVDHGVEMPEDRLNRGKTGAGKVSLIIYRQAAEFVIRLMDDGKGLAPETLRQKAVEHNILNEGERISEEDALQLIFHSGLSTASKVTGISGRGVGMDVVQQSIAQIGGTIEVDSKPGFYTQFDIRVPASIMVNGALLATIGEEQVAVPLTSLDGSDFRHRDEIIRFMGNNDEWIEHRGEEYELRYLGTVRGTLPPPPPESMPEFVPVLFARHDRRLVAFYADSVTNAEELVIRTLGAQFTSVAGIAGGSLKSDGQPVLALDLNELIRQVDYADAQSGLSAVRGSARLLVLCVDDSVMMRRTFEKRLESLGYEVVTAEDGEAALDYLAAAPRIPDFIFTDLEMPNMNGFDFIKNLRRVPNFQQIPTVVVSSRDGDKHRVEATRVGATDFMAKGANSAEAMQAIIEKYLPSTAMAS